MEPYTHKVQYYETDQMGIVHHSNYIRWFEEARTDLLEKMDMGYDSMEAAGIISPVLSVSCEYKSMTHYGDTVEIAAAIEKYNGIKLSLRYTVKDIKTGEIRAEGGTSHCFLDKNGKILSLKRSYPSYHQAFEDYKQKNPVNP